MALLGCEAWRCGARARRSLCLFLALLVTEPVFAQDLLGRASVIDGDTLEIHGQRVRLHGLDAPESAQRCADRKGETWRCGQRAALALAEQIGSRPLHCRGRRQDHYGRLIAVCTQDGLDINDWLVRQGWAVAYRRYSMDYVEAETQAREEEVGVWLGNFVMPWDYRKKRWEASTQKAPDPSCPIKGNINRKGERLYHTPWGSPSYDRTKINEMT